MTKFESSPIPQEERMNWDSFDREVRRLAEKIDYTPDMIVGIVRGGIIPARLLSTCLNVGNMYCLTAKKNGENRQVMADILEDVGGKKVLLVEDMLETGRSLIAVRDYLEKKGASVKTACLYIMPISEIIPDYYLGERIDVPKFPWE